ncbi:MAG: rRNA ((966)-N(2))-methyltransferase RsmD [Actinomycetota bacterium]
MTRIVSGMVGGHPLRVPSAGTRPTSDRVREALFSSLDSAIAGRWGEQRVLDLFAGSGALGLEAASRGAGEVAFVESNAKANAVLRENVRAIASALNVSGARAPNFNVHAQSVESWVPPHDFTLTFMDPPYSVTDEHIRGLLEGLVSAGAFASGSLIVVERDRRSASPFPETITLWRDRPYGDTRLWYGHAQDRTT